MLFCGNADVVGMLMLRVYSSFVRQLSGCAFDEKNQKSCPELPVYRTRDGRHLSGVRRSLERGSRCPVQIFTWKWLITGSYAWFFVQSAAMKSPGITCRSGDPSTDYPDGIVSDRCPMVP